MKSSEIRPKFNMTYGDLLQLADKLVSFGRRDIADLSPHGISTAWLDTIEAKNEVCKNFSNDFDMVGRQRRATLNKDKSRDHLHALVHRVFFNVKATFGSHSPEYARFGNKNISKLSDTDFARMALNVHNILAELMPQLATSSVVPIDLVELDAAITQFYQSITVKDLVIAERDSQTQQRVTLFNDVYNQLIILSDFAKSVFYSTDEARYNDYVIYDVPSTAKPTDQKKDTAAEAAKTDVPVAESPADPPVNAPPAIDGIVP